MQLTTRGRYAVMAMAELACRIPDHGRAAAALGDIAEVQQISACYLEQLFSGLRRAGLVTSARGPGGGYSLARSAAEISIADILQAVDEAVRTTRCADGLGCMHNADGTRERCCTHDLWSELERHINAFLASVTLDDVVTGRLGAQAALAAATAAPAKQRLPA